jgi:hypothetical protein
MLSMSRDDAALMFSKWKAHSPLLRIMSVASLGMFNAVGILADFSGSALELAGNGWTFTFPLLDVSFQFTDPREAGSEEVRQSAKAKYDCGIEILFPSGDRLALLEMNFHAGTAAENEGHP